MKRLARIVCLAAPGLALCMPASGQTGSPEPSFALPKLPPPVQAQPEALLTYYFEPAVGLEYNDNVFRANDGQERDDFAFVLAPSGRLVLTGDDVRGEASLGIEIGRFFDFTQNDYEDVDLRGRMTWAYDDVTDFGADVRARREHNAINENAGDVQRTADEVTEFYELEAGLSAERRFDLWTAGLTGDVQYLDFEDTTSTSSGPKIFNGDRDLISFEGGAQLGRDIGGGVTLFAEALAGHTNYFTNIEGRNFDRSSANFGGLAGARYKSPGGDLFAELGAGLLYRDYAADSLDDVLFPGFRAEVRYRPDNDALEVRARARTDIRDTDLVVASGFKNARADLDASYDIADDLTAFAGLGLEWREFAVDSSLSDERTDILASGEAGVRYIFLAPTFVEFKARYDERYSDERAARYDALRLSISVGAAF